MTIATVAMVGITAYQGCRNKEANEISMKVFDASEKSRLAAEAAATQSDADVKASLELTRKRLALSEKMLQAAQQQSVAVQASARSMTTANEISRDQYRARLGLKLVVMASANPIGPVPGIPEAPAEGRTITNEEVGWAQLTLTNFGPQAARGVVLLRKCVVSSREEPGDVPCALEAPASLVIEPREERTIDVTRSANLSDVMDHWEGRLTAFVYAQVRYQDGNGGTWMRESCIRYHNSMRGSEECRLHNREYKAR